MPKKPQPSVLSAILHARNMAAPTPRKSPMRRTRNAQRRAGHHQLTPNLGMQRNRGRDDEENGEERPDEPPIADDDEDRGRSQVPDQRDEDTNEWTPGHHAVPVVIPLECGAAGARIDAPRVCGDALRQYSGDIISNFSARRFAEADDRSDPPRRTPAA